MTKTEAILQLLASPFVLALLLICLGAIIVTVIFERKDQ